MNSTNSRTPHGNRAVGGVVAPALPASPPATAQPAAQAAASQPSQAEAPKDPLGRETPRASLLGFMRAARGGNPELASQYLDTALQERQAQELARQLYVVLDSRLPARIDEISDRPEGRLANPLRPEDRKSVV